MSRAESPKWIDEAYAKAYDEVGDHRSNPLCRELWRELCRELKYPKATTCLEKDREELLAFYDFPAEHWERLRTANPIESTLATVRLWTAQTRSCLSRQTMLTMVFQLCHSVEQRWFRLRGYRRLGEVIENLRFVNEVRDDKVAVQCSASADGAACRC